MAYAGAWTSGVSYYKGDVVSYRGQLWESANDQLNAGPCSVIGLAKALNPLAKTTTTVVTLPAGSAVGHYVLIDVALAPLATGPSTSWVTQPTTFAPTTHDSNATAGTVVDDSLITFFYTYQLTSTDITNGNLTFPIQTNVALATGATLGVQIAVLTGASGLESKTTTVAISATAVTGLTTTAAALSGSSAVIAVWGGCIAASVAWVAGLSNAGNTMTTVQNNFPAASNTYGIGQTLMYAPITGGVTNVETFVGSITSNPMAQSTWVAAVLGFSLVFVPGNWNLLAANGPLGNTYTVKSGFGGFTAVAGTTYNCQETANITATLPTGNVLGDTIFIGNNGAYAITVQASGTDTLDMGSSSLVLPAGGTLTGVTLTSTGTGIWIVDPQILANGRGGVAGMYQYQGAWTTATSYYKGDIVEINNAKWVCNVDQIYLGTPTVVGMAKVLNASAKTTTTVVTLPAGSAAGHVVLIEAGLAPQTITPSTSWMTQPTSFLPSTLSSWASTGAAVTNSLVEYLYSYVLTAADVIAGTLTFPIQGNTNNASSATLGVQIAVISGSPGIESHQTYTAYNAAAATGVTGVTTAVSGSAAAFAFFGQTMGANIASVSTFTPSGNTLTASQTSVPSSGSGGIGQFIAYLSVAGGAVGAETILGNTVSTPSAGVTWNVQVLGSVTGFVAANWTRIDHDMVYAGIWLTNTSYYVGDCVATGGKLYVCTTPYVASGSATPLVRGALGTAAGYGSLATAQLMSLPAGSAAGDICMVFLGNFNQTSIPTTLVAPTCAAGNMTLGYTVQLSSTYFETFGYYYCTLTSTDITNGHVSVPQQNMGTSSYGWRAQGYVINNVNPVPSTSGHNGPFVFSSNVTTRASYASNAGDSLQIDFAAGQSGTSGTGSGTMGQSSPTLVVAANTVSTAGTQTNSVIGYSASALPSTIPSNLITGQIGSSGTPTLASISLTFQTASTPTFAAQIANWTQLSSGAGLGTYTSKSASFAAAANNMYLVTAAATATLPTGGYVGDEIIIKKEVNTTFAVSIACSGSDTFDDGTTTWLLPAYLNNIGVVAHYTGTTWLISPMNDNVDSTIVPLSSGATYTAHHNDFIEADGTSSSQVIVIPVTAGVRVTVKRMDASTFNSITVVGASGTVDGDSTATLVGQYTSAVFVADGTNVKVESINGHTSIPGGGNGEVLMKNSSTDYDYSWTAKDTTGANEWVVVGSPNGPAFQNGWVHYDNGFNYAPARFRVDAKGKLRMSGLIANTATTPTTTIFTLPVNCWPDVAMVFHGNGGSGGGEVVMTVTTDGKVTVSSYFSVGGAATSGYISLEEIRFFPAAISSTLPWVYPTLINSWVAYGSPYITARYYIDVDGIVHWGGLIRSGTISTICLLPAFGSGTDGLETIFMKPSAGGTCRVDATSNALNISIYGPGGTNGYLSLEGIEYIGLNNTLAITAISTNFSAYGNSWVSYSTVSFNPLRFVKDSAGVVHMSGLVKSGTAPAAFLSIPLAPGFRPRYGAIWLMCAGNYLCRLDLFSTGILNITSYGTSGTNAFVSFDGISYLAEA